MTQSNPPGWPPTWPRHDGPGPILAGVAAVSATAVAVLAGILAVGWWLA